MPGSMMAKKPLSMILGEAAESGEHSLKRALGAMNLISLGIGAIIGTGIFVLTGAAAANHAGPSIIFSFILAAFASLFAGLCYAEFAVHDSGGGSAYTYGYATLGELVAWIIGWDLILEYAFGAATVATRLERVRHQLPSGFRHHINPALAVPGLIGRDAWPGTNLLLQQSLGNA